MRGAAIIPRAVALIFACGLAMGPLRASAEPEDAEARQDAEPRIRPSMAVLSVGHDATSGTEGTRAAEILERWARSSGRFVLVSWSDALNPAAARAREKAVQDGVEASAAGIKAYGDLDTQKAQKSFERAMRAFELTDLSQNFPNLSKAWVMKIACLYANGDTKTAESELQRLLTVDPDAEFLPNYFSPDQIRQVERARKKIKEGLGGPLKLSSDPARAKVYVDGRFRGVSPVSLDSIPAGEHYLTLQAPGYALTQGRSRASNVKLALRPSERGALGTEAALQRIAASSKVSVRDREARDLGALAGVDQIVLLSGEAPNPNRLELTAVRLAVVDGHTLGFEKEVIPTGDALPDAMTPLASRLLGADAKRRDGAPVTQRGGSFEWTRRTTGYTLLGAGVLLAGAGILWGLSASRADAAYRSLPQTDPGSAALKSRGKRAALLADLSFLGSAVAVGFGSYFTFFGNPPDQERVEGSR